MHTYHFPMAGLLGISKSSGLVTPMQHTQIAAAANIAAAGAGAGGTSTGTGPGVLV